MRSVTNLGEPDCPAEVTVRTRPQDARGRLWVLVAWLDLVKGPDIVSASTGSPTTPYGQEQHSNVIVAACKTQDWIEVERSDQSCAP